MMDFLSVLYANEKFTTYLVGALIILVVLFVIVLLFGKKDQKLEETKKLQKIELEKNNNEDVNTFKEISTDFVSVETPAITTNQEIMPLIAPVEYEKKVIESTSEIPMPEVETPSVTEETQVLPIINEEEMPVLPEINDSIVNEPEEMPVIPEISKETTIFEKPANLIEQDIILEQNDKVFNPIDLPPEQNKEEIQKDDDEVEVTIFAPAFKPIEQVANNSIENISVLSKTQELAKLNVEDLPTYVFDDEKMEKDLNELENIKKKFNSIKIPKLEEKRKEEPQKVYKPGPQVFSSVFVNNKKEQPKEEVKPEIKNEPLLKIESNKNTQNNVSLFTIQDDDEETIDLPTLK